MALSADPGALDPQGSASSPLFQVSKFAYDSLVSVDAKGQVNSGLASKWSVSGTTVTFEIGQGITCADGAPFTAQTAVDNISYVEDPKNKSPFLGVFVPAGATATASGSTVTVKLATASPFVLDSFAQGRHRRHRPLHAQ
jgi:peptide/nickel transport system substrate-binding protein